MSEINELIESKNPQAPRITPADIDAKIAKVVYFTAAEGIQGSNLIQTADIGHTLLTFCVITLKNGYMVTGESACVSPENFDAEIGKAVAYRNAYDKIWTLEGYLLKESLL